jgi:hypothetical protein
VRSRAAEPEPTLARHRHSHRGAQRIVTDAAALADLCLGQPTRSSERLADDLNFRVVLGRRSEMLPVAAPAPVAHVAARRLHTKRRRRCHTDEAGAREVAFRLDDLDVDVLVADDALDEHHATVGVAGHAVTASDETLDVQSSRVADVRS